MAAHGLQHNLAVRLAEDGIRHEFVVGGRRLKALKLLVKRKALAKDTPISCKVLHGGNDTEEISLAENVQRLGIHPLEEFDAFNASSPKSKCRLRTWPHASA